ncbi:hypothetical protein Tco_0722173 [Tanacetum coccineum]
MVPSNNLGPDLSGKAVNETQYKGMIRSLMYPTACRPDIQFSTCLCSRYQANPKKSHLIAFKRIFKYLKGTPSLGPWYPKCSGFDLKGYSDSDYASCNMDRKSTSSACQLLGGKLVCWRAKKYQSVAMSSAKAEYVAATGCCANILWMKSQLTDYDIIYEKVPIFCDNTSAIAISNNPVMHLRTRHVDIRYHFIKDHILKGDIKLHFIPTQYQLADIFTKPLDEPTFKRLIVELGQFSFCIQPLACLSKVIEQSHMSHSWICMSMRGFVAFAGAQTLVNPRTELNWFILFKLVDFTFDEITFTTNNEIALLYPSHPYQEYFKDVLDYIFKCCLNEAFTRAPTQYKEYLSEFWYTTKILEGSKVDYAKIIWEDLIHKLNKKTREKIIPYPRFISLLLKHKMPEYDNEELTINPTQVFSVHNWTLKPNQPEEPPFTTHMKAICNLDVLVDSKALKPSSQTEEVPQGKKPGAKSGLRRKQSSKHTSESKSEASKSKTGQLEKDTQSSSARDKSPSHTSPPTPVVGEMHKEAQQAGSGPTSLGATSEEGSHPQLSSGGHRDHVSACLCHMLYCIETSTPYNLAFFFSNEWKRLETNLRNSCLMTRLFKDVVFVFPELAIDHYLSHDRVMHPLAPHYERKTRSDHGKKRPRD